ncbi:hypothetical protein A0H81_02657 [Grifola frondosa]|uniref:RNase H type-1 domain-containing protein n=1 Tax=Grifola frondosa TaxID=5627 RepID=A0A1C7MN73_GRIFR|nr:hypothetical protein A0H81_02657 [Grifola frondosa]
MLYAADVFLTPVRMLPGSKRLHGSVGAIKRLERVQRQALLIMTGAMRTTATDIMCAHANLLPFTLLVDKICHRAITRICTLPKTHPLHRHVRWAGRKFVADHRRHLRNWSSHTIYILRLLKPSYLLDSTPLETATQHRHRTDKEEATRDEGDWCRRPSIRVYSDGSDVDGGVGAAAVLFKPGNPGYKVLRFHLGSSDDHSVYEAEVVGLLLGTELLKTERSLEGASIAADNKSSIQATKLRRPAPAHYLLDSLHKHLRALGRKHHEAKVTIRWVPGHMDLEGNETADLKVKCAARGDTSPIEDLPDILRDGLPRSATKMRQVFLTDLQGKAKTAWNSRAVPNLSPPQQGTPLQEINENSLERCRDGKQTFSFNFALNTSPYRSTYTAYGEQKAQYARHATRHRRRSTISYLHARRTRTTAGHTSTGH